MTAKPVFFETIRLRAAHQWDLLEKNPELAAPWHQLFKQVQSPRHIVSELLQNADDAGAGAVTVRIDNEVFIFEHNGEDFSEEHFASLCRFGYSNKRALHTIGFRGVGFKSIFSLGDSVEVFSPTLAVSFHRRRFTEPIWLSKASCTGNRTRIRVQIKDVHRKKELEKNLAEWLDSPISLLFFRNIRRIGINDQVVHWSSLGAGPIPDSEWIALHEDKESPFLLVRSAPEEFPAEALEEIRQERMLGVDEDAVFPACRVELLLGAQGRLFVVLPTGVATDLPFACNAPFIQDPARLKIKDPETSPINRWLLKRVGQLAASSMLRWLGQSEMSAADRAPAYRLLPDVDRDDNSLEGVCGTIVEEACDEALHDLPVLLTDEGRLTYEKGCIVIPRVILEVWSAQEASRFLDEKGRPILCQPVEPASRKKLVNWGLVDEIDKQDFFAALENKQIPTPKTWDQVLSLWVFLAPELTDYRNTISVSHIKIVPAEGKDLLFASGELVRLGEKKLLQSKDDWKFLAEYLIVLNQDWLRFLSDRKRLANSKLDQERVQGAYAVLKKIGLDEASDVNKVIEQVAGKFFAQESVKTQECVQLAQIAAKLVAAVGRSFCYFTRGGELRSIEEGVLFDEDGILDEILPDREKEVLLLHSDYVDNFSSCTKEEWLSWISSGRAGLLTFVPLVQNRIFLSTKKRVEQEARKRGLEGDLSYPYVNGRFLLEDWDFEQLYWDHWKSLAKSDDHLWTKVAHRIMSQRDSCWDHAKSARLLQIATNGSKRSMTHESLLPMWVLRLRDLPCMADNRGFTSKPGDLLLRTPETESLMDIEPFVHARLDTEKARPLLKLLGGRTTASGPDRLLDCLRALSKAEKPRVNEVEKWYRRLDQMADVCGTTDFQKIKQAFWSEKLILSQEDAWVTAAIVFLCSDEEDAPGAEVIRASVRDLTLWRKIGVAERPNADLAIQWLKTLPSGQVPLPEDAKRIRALLVRHSARIWEACEHWLNLATEWVPVKQLSYAITMQSLTPWRHLHQWVKQNTADFQRLPIEVSRNPPFSGLPALAHCVDERLDRDSVVAAGPEKEEWLTVLGKVLRRIELDTSEETRRVRELAKRLEMTRWYAAQKLQVIPYIDGTPAGMPRQADILWLDYDLYIERMPKAKLARRVPEEIGKVFSHPDIRAALDYSFDRSAEDIRAYIEENFKLSQLESEGDLTTLQEESSGTNITTDDREMGPSEVASESEISIAQSDADETPALDETEWVTRDSTGESQVSSRPAIRAMKPSIIERFAKSQGFTKETDGAFVHNDGSSIRRARGSCFPWERRTAAGDLVRYYWPKDQCLEHEPIEVEADVWGLVSQNPKFYSLILLNLADEAIEITGVHLRAMLSSGKIRLYPASYRLVCEHQSEE